MKGVMHQEWLDKLRANAMQRFLELGFPTTKLEEWKYTNVAPIARVNFQPAANLQPAGMQEATRAQVERFPNPRLVFVNGMLEDATAPFATSLGEALGAAANFPLLKRHFGRYAGAANHPFIAWNTALFADGVFVVIPPNTRVSEPIHLVYVSTAAPAPRVISPRNLVLAGKGSRVSIVETYMSEPGEASLTNSVTEITAAEGAAVDYYKLEYEAATNFHVSNAAISLDRDARLTSHSFSLGAALVRNELRIAMEGEGSECTLNGLFLVDGDRLADNHTEIDHRKPHAQSRELYKGILTGRGAGVFNGAIVVRKDAQKTNAVQHSRNLLLSGHAQINTKPQLEIRADDVRCAHGASIGQINTDALFYLRTRGIDERTARRTLVRGFAAEILEGVRVPSVRAELEHQLDRWFETRLEAA